MRKPKAFFFLISLCSLLFLSANSFPVLAATAWSANGSTLFYNDGKVSIGTNSPIWAKLTIQPSSRSEDQLILKDPGSNNRFRFITPDDMRLIIAPQDWTTGNTNYNAFTMIRNGNIGIGTQNPSSMLSVNGTIKARELIVTNQGWADYVFDNSYNLLPLDQVAEYIQANKHLPDVASASEIESQGISVGDMQKTQMQKIEELTLYVIQLQKEINELQQK